MLTRDDHVRLAIGEVQVAVIVEVADVAERPPPPLIGHRRRLGRVVVVLERSTADKLDGPRLPDRGLEMGLTRFKWSFALLLAHDGARWSGITPAEYLIKQLWPGRRARRR